MVDRILTSFMSSASNELGSFPDNSFTRTVASKANQRILLFSIEALDCVGEASFWVLFDLRLKWIVNVLRPPFFLECGQNCLLVCSRPFEPLDNLAMKLQLSCCPVPGRRRQLFYS